MSIFKEPFPVNAINLETNESRISYPKASYSVL